MLYLHETHAVIGEHETTFERHYREGYLGPVAEDPEARLLWYLDSTHGAGEGYKVVTITGFATPEAYERLLGRLLEGDLATWMARADELRYSLEGMLLVDAPGSEPPDLASVPADGSERERVLFRQDAVWSDDAEAATRATEAARPAGDDVIVGFERAFVPVLAGVDPSPVVVLHRIPDPQRWIGAWHDDVAEWPGGLGALPGETRRVVRVLRTSAWSPLA